MLVNTPFSSAKTSPGLVKNSLCLAIGAVVVAIFLTLVPLAFHLVSAFSAHDVSRLMQWPTFFACALCLSFKSTQEPHRSIAAAKLFAGVVLSILAMTSVETASEPGHALRELCLLLGLLGTATCVAALQFDTLARPLLLMTCVGSAAYAAIVFLIALVVVASGLNLVASELFFGYDSYRFYNHAQTVSLPLAALVAVGGRTASTRSVGWLALILGFALLLLGTGRATSLGLIAGCAVPLVLFWRSALRFVAVMVAAAAGGALSYGLLMVALPWALNLPPPAALLDEVSSTGSYEARLFLWRLAIDYIRESPWLGIGPMHYAHRVNIEAAHPHNIYLQVAAEWGVPMLLMLLTISLWALWRFSQRIRSCGDAAEQTMGVGLFAGCVAVAVDGFFSGNFVMPVSQMWIAFLFGLSIAWYRSQAPQEVQGSTSAIPLSKWYRAGRFALAAALVGSQLWLLYSVYPEAAHLAEHLEHVQKDLAPNPRTNPRFWSHGWF